jgi:hypothetical protein
MKRLEALRILIGGYALVYLVARMAEIYQVSKYGASHFVPVGVVRILHAPLPPWLVLVIAIATCIALAGMVAGRAYQIVAPLAALGLLWTLSYRNSWGMVFHTENLLVLHVIALAVCPRDKAWPVKLMAALTVLTYLMAGIAKLRIAGFAWADGDLLRNQIAVDNLRKALLGDGVAPLAQLFLEHPAPLYMFSCLSLALELGAPLALLPQNPRLGYMWVMTAWAFHLGVVLLMNIWFPYPLLGFAFLPLLPAEKIIAMTTTVVVMLRRSS